MATTADIQTSAYKYAEQAFENSVTSINNMTSILDATRVDLSLDITQPSKQFSHIGFSPAPAAPYLPSFDGVRAPVAPSIAAFTVPDIGTIPTFTAAEPIINLPVAPDPSLPGAPGAAPAVSMPALPTAPSIVLPDVPTFAPVDIPTPDTISLPVFNASTDFGDVIAPTVSFQWSEQEYQSVLLDAVKSKLLNDILNGGYGIDDADERRLWDRARERELVNASAKMAELARMNAARNFALPPGVLQAQQEEAQQALLEKNSSLSRDIASKRADMYVENRKFTIQAAREVEDMLMRYYGSFAERALNAARTQVEMGVAIFNAQVARFNAKLEQFRVFAAAYESQVRAALASVEIYKAKVEGAKLSMEAQKLHADVYATQLQGANALISMYRTQMEAAQVGAQIENLRLQGFETEVKAYAEQVRAKAAEFGMFEAQIKGETAKIAVYDANVRAYAARLSGVQTQAEVARTRAQTEIAQATATLDIYKTDMERYRNEIGVVSEKIRAVLQKHDNEVKAYTADTQALAAYGEQAARTDEANSRNYIAYAQLVSERLRVMIEQVLKDMEIRASSHNEAGKTSASLGAAWAQAVTGISAQIE